MVNIKTHFYTCKKITKKINTDKTQNNILF